MSWTTPIGDARTNLAARHHQERVQAAQAKARIALETGNADPHPNDARTWRGGGDSRYRIPTIGLNTGAIPGTIPHNLAH